MFECDPSFIDWFDNHYGLGSSVKLSAAVKKKRYPKNLSEESQTARAVDKQTSKTSL